MITNIRTLVMRWIRLGILPPALRMTKAPGRADHIRIGHRVVADPGAVTAQQNAHAGWPGGNGLTESRAPCARMAGLK